MGLNFGGTLFNPLYIPRENDRRIIKNINSVINKKIDDAAPER